MNSSSTANSKSRNRKNPWPLVLVIFLGAVSLVLAALYLFSDGAPAGASSDGELTYKVVRGPLTISFTERGTVKAANSEEIYCELEGMSTIVSIVSEGTYVKKGDLLVELDSSELTQMLNQQEISVQSALAALTYAKEQVEIQKSQNKSDLQAAQLAMELAKIDKEKYEKGDYPLALSKATADIDIAEEEKFRAKNKCNWTEKLAEKGYVTKTELITDRIALHKAEVQADQSKTAKTVLEDYTHLKDSKQRASDLAQALQALERAQLKASSMLAQAEAEMRAKESTYKLSDQRLKKIKDQLDKTQILAPQDGMVVYHQEGRWGRADRMIEQGGTVRERQHLIDLPDLSVMAVTVQVPEARIHQIAVSLPATVSIEAQTEVVLRGAITKIGILPDSVNRWLNPDLKVYSTDITVDPKQDTKLMRPGMSAKVEILVKRLDDALDVPIQSVTTIDGAPVCYLLSGGEFVPRQVETGFSNNSFIVIKSGLSEGDLVQLNAPAPKGEPPKVEEKEMEIPDVFTSDGSGGRPVPAAFQGEGGRRSRGGPRGGGEMDRETRRKMMESFQQRGGKRPNFGDGSRERPGGGQDRRGEGRRKRDRQFQRPGEGGTAPGGKTSKVPPTAIQNRPVSRAAGS